MSRLTSLSRSVSGRVAVITGAASGMGRATAMLFADEGARVVAVDRNEVGVGEIEALIKSAHGPGSVIGIAADTTNRSNLEDIVTTAVATFGALDILINNAGVSAATPLRAGDEFDLDWERVFAVNIRSYIDLIRIAIPFLSKSNSPRIVNIASTEAIVATPGLSAYSASKSAVTGLTRSLAVELGPTGITVNCICPGPVHTGMTELIPDDMKEKYARRRVALRRYGDPEEVAHMTLSLCLPAMSFLTGASIPVDGGLTIRHT